MSTQRFRSHRPDQKPAAPARRWFAVLLGFLAAGLCLGGRLADPPPSPPPPYKSPGEALEAGKAHAGKGCLAEAKAAFEQALELTRKASDPNAEAKALLGLGNALLELDDLPAAEGRFKQALELCHAAGDRRGEAEALVGLGDADTAAGHRPEAKERYETARALYREAGDRHGEAEALYRLGVNRFQADRCADALAAYEAALPLYQETGDIKSEADTLSCMGTAHWHLGRLTRALECLEKALPLEREAGDRNSEAITLNNIASVLEDLGRAEQALEYGEKSLAIRRELGDRRGEAITLSRIGSLHDSLGRKAKALESYEQALPIRREVGDRRGEAYTLNNIGLVYADLGRMDLALAHYEQALPILRETGDRRTEAVTLQNIGVALDNLGRKARAVEYFEKALPLLRGIPDPRNESVALQSLGQVYWSLGLLARALECYEKALSIARAGENRRTEAVVLHNIGAVHQTLGANARALECYASALPILREVGDRRNEAAVLNSLGSIRSRLGETEAALDYFEKALLLKRETGDRGGEGYTLNNIGLALYRAGRITRARERFLEALPLLREVGDRRDEAACLHNLARVVEREGRSRLGVLLGKLSVRACQEVRGEVQRLGPEARRAYLMTVRNVYRDLADALLRQKRPAEAHQVISLLKEQEYFDYTGGAGAVKAPALEFTPLELRMEARFQEALSLLSRLGGEATLLRFRKTLSPGEEARLAALGSACDEARKNFRETLASIGKILEDRGPREKCIVPGPAEELQADLRAAGKGTAVVYLLMGGERAWLLGVTPGDLRAWEAGLGAGDLFSTAAAFRRWLQHPGSDPRHTGKKLYDALILPLRDWRKEKGVRRILWSPDWSFRYVPIGALWNGERYFVEELPVSVFTPAARGDRAAPVQGPRRALAAGVSQALGNFTALSGVPDELRSVVRQDGSPGGILPGRVLLDEGFTEARLRDGLREGYSVLHLATHFQFNPEGEGVSFLLLGDGSRLSLEAMRTGEPLFRGLDLLTLSACQTGVGAYDSLGAEIEGFGVMAQRQGARSVIATLWPVADDSTRALMQGFYQAWARRGVPRSDALREAQLSLLRGQAVVVTPGAGRGGETEGSAAPPGGIRASEKAPCAHPYYWASFILMGAWD